MTVAAFRAVLAAHLEATAAGELHGELIASVRPKNVTPRT